MGRVHQADALPGSCDEHRHKGVARGEGSALGRSSLCTEPLRLVIDTSSTSLDTSSSTKPVSRRRMMNERETTTEEAKAKSYEPPVVLATYSIEELRRDAAVGTVSAL